MEPPGSPPYRRRVGALLAISVGLAAASLLVGTLTGADTLRDALLLGALCLALAAFATAIRARR